MHKAASVSQMKNHILWFLYNKKNCVTKLLQVVFFYIMSQVQYLVEIMCKLSL